MKRRAISEEEERELTDLPPLDFDRLTMGKCSNCGGSLGPGEVGLCPQCQGEGGGRKQRHRQKQMRTQRGGVERQSMREVVERIWAQSSIWRPTENEQRTHGWDPEGHPMDEAQFHHTFFKGRNNHVPVGRNTWVHKDDAGNYHIRYHNTDILSVDPQGNHTVNMGGFHTRSTIERVNAFLPEGVRVWRPRPPSRGRRYSGFLLSHHGVSDEYHDGVSFDYQGNRLGDDHVRPTSEAVRPPHARGRGNPGPPRSRSEYVTPPERRRPNFSVPEEEGYGERRPYSMPSRHPAFDPSTRAPRRVTPPSYERRPAWDEHGPSAIEERNRRRDQRHPAWDEGEAEDSGYGPGMHYDPRADRRRLEEADESGPYNEGISWDTAHTYQAPRPHEGEDMPQEGEDFYDWLRRTTPQARFDKCSDCRGKGTKRAGPDMTRQTCDNCAGHGYVDHRGRPYDPENPHAHDEGVDIDDTSHPDHPHKHDFKFPTGGGSISGPCARCNHGIEHHSDWRRGDWQQRSGGGWERSPGEGPPRASGPDVPRERTPEALQEPQQHAFNHGGAWSWGASTPCQDCGQEAWRHADTSVGSGDRPLLDRVPTAEHTRGEDGHQFTPNGPLAYGVNWCGTCGGHRSTHTARRHASRQDDGERLTMRYLSGLRTQAFGPGPEEPMLRTLVGIWAQGSAWRPGRAEQRQYGWGRWGGDAFSNATDKYERYRGREHHVPIGNNTWIWKDTNDNHHIRHHNTDIMSFSPEGHITVDPNHYHTVSTMQRINAFMPSGWNLYAPRRRRNAPLKVLHTPNGEEHPYNGSITFHPHTGEVWQPDDDGPHVRPNGISVKPPNAGVARERRAPRSRPSRNYYDTDTSYAPPPQPQARPGYTEDDVRELEYAEHSRGHDSYGGDSHVYRAPSGHEGEDMPQEGEDFYDWLRRTTPQARFDKCRDCRGKGTRRTGPDMSREQCSSCAGHGYVDQHGQPYNPEAPARPAPEPTPTIRGRIGEPRPAGAMPEEHDPFSPDGHDYSPGVHGSCEHCGYSPALHGSWNHDEWERDHENNTWRRRETHAGTPTGQGISDHPYTPVGGNDCLVCGEPGPRHTRLSSRRASRHYDPEVLTMRYISGLRTIAYGETKAPMAVDTLREENCPVCGEHDSYDGDTCQVCGFITPPKMFQDPDLDAARLMDLRQDPNSGDPNNTSGDLPPVDPNAVDEQGNVEGEEWPPQGSTPQGPADEGVVNVETEGLGDEQEPAADVAQQQMQQIQETGQPLTPEQLGPHGEVEPTGGMPVDPNAADKHFDQGGEPFTPGPNAAQPEQPMEQEQPEEPEEDEEQPEGREQQFGQGPDEAEQPDEAEEGQEMEPGGPDAGQPGKAGDQVPDLLCPSCGFEADSAQPTSTPGAATEPANQGDGMLAGDVCPNCQQATLMSVGEMQQMEEQQQVPV